MFSRQWNRHRLRVLLRKEVKDLARDRKVIVAALLLPALLFPALLVFSSQFLTASRLAPQTFLYRIGVTGNNPLLDELIAVTRGASWATHGRIEDVTSGDLDAVVKQTRDSDGRPELSILFDGSRAISINAKELLERNLEHLFRKHRKRALARANIDAASLPGRAFDFLDISVQSARTQDHIPRFLPMLLILVLISASAFAALDLFPGERERGTLETLLVQPLRPSEALGAKFIAVFSVGIIAVVANLFGLWLMTWMKSLALETAGISVYLLLTLFLLCLPLCLFVSACLVRVVARARSVKEGQHYLLPLTLACLLPPFLAGSPHVPFDMFTACLPLAGPALAFREVIHGNFDFAPIFTMVAMTTAITLFVLHGAVKHLSTEEGLLCDDGSAGRGGRALVLVLFSILLVFSLSPFFRNMPAISRIALPLVFFVGLPAILFCRWAGMSQRKLLLAPPPGFRDVVIGLSTGLGLALLATCIGELQRNLLPMPQVFKDDARTLLGHPPLGWPVALLLLAVLPALLEELLYRRLLLTRLLDRKDPSRALLVTAALFAVHHLSIFRFFPTVVAGLVLGFLVIRSRCFWTSPIAHATSNALIVMSTVKGFPLFNSFFAAVLLESQFLEVRLLFGLLLVAAPWFVYPRTRAVQPAVAVAPAG